MKYIISAAIFFGLFFGVGYLILKFFSGLAGVDMLKAFTWGFRAKKLVIVLNMIMFYLIAFVFFFAIITTPVFMSGAKLTQKGGLLGYQADDYIYKYYDPLQGKYLEVKNYNPPPAADSFNEAFSIVSFYKPLFANYYDNISNLSLVVSIIKLIFFLIGAAPFYLTLYALADEYGKHISISRKITHRLISDNFTEMTRLNVLVAIGAVILVIIIITAVSFIVSSGITREHKKIYGGYMTEFRDKIKKSIAPGTKLAGRVIRREHTTFKEYTRQNDNADSNNKSAKYYPSEIYTIEFSGILNIPVYINYQLIGDADTNKFIAQLNVLFSDKKRTVPSEFKDTEFFVTQGLSISLPGQEL